MDQGARGWVIKTSRENYWRVSSYMEFDDLLQEAAMVWQRVYNKYQGVREPKHLMALFKTAFTNQIHDLSKKNTALPTTECDLGTALDVLLDVPDHDQDADLSLIIAQLPGAIQRAILKIADPSHGHPFRERLDGTRETSGERITRLAGLDRGRDIRRAILAYLAGHRLHPQYE